MNKIFNLVFISFLIIGKSYGQSPCTFQAHYDDFISISSRKIDGKNFLSKSIILTEKPSCVSPYIKEQKIYFNYLLTNFSSKEYYPELLAIEDSLQLRAAFLRNLKNDTMYNNVMNEYGSKVITRQVPKDTVSLDELTQLAVKFFSLLDITKEGYYAGKVCVGVNDILKTEPVRKPLLEAFAFAAIIKYYNDEKYNLLAEFSNGIKELYELNLGNDQGERLLRAQGALYMMMYRNEVLRNALQSFYHERKDAMPFVLVEKK